ncbi:50S ribosomal protein L25 [Pseudothermotoga thermarum]|uniref:Large ribosomal subunit protein bL25 n=1 Tax=Pseudothermotoga thermarum DSM 5069 TaxID=688269 RepID=F7YYA1_9THEM|nr:50S ribosomal protein L25 [Pseudothermotoga thermarum]AEH50922.1 LSU ribosomal protein L25P [Pseudothermotoga thermarum DSM 5069]
MEIKAAVREVTGKRPVRRLRKQGFIPGVVYGPDVEPINIVLEANQFKKLVGKISESVPIKLVLEREGKTEVFDVFMKKVQIDKVTDEILHIDFYKPAAGRTMKINIPVKIVGKAIGVEKGGILEVMRNEIPVETLPTAVLEYIEVDVSNLDVGDSLHVGDLKLPEGMKTLLSKDEVVVTVLSPAGEEEETSVSQAAPTEPEVIKKGKKEEEEEEE